MTREVFIFFKEVFLFFSVIINSFSKNPFQSFPTAFLTWIIVSATKLEFPPPKALLSDSSFKLPPGDYFWNAELIMLLSSLLLSNSCFALQLCSMTPPWMPTRILPLCLPSVGAGKKPRAKRTLWTHQEGWQVILVQTELFKGRSTWASPHTHRPGLA